MELRAKASIAPLLGQISVGDADSVDIPEWTTGTESSVRSAHVVLVATPPDTDGAISCRIWTGATAPLWESVVFDDELSFPSGRMQVGSIVGAESITATVGTGSHRVMVRAYPVEGIKVVDAFVFTGS